MRNETQGEPQPEGQPAPEPTAPEPDTGDDGEE